MGRHSICLLCISVETPSLEASLHLPRHIRVSLASGSCHVLEHRHGSTTQPPERGVLQVHMHTHNNLGTRTELTDTARYRHINTATQLSAQRWLAPPARPQGLGWCCGTQSYSLILRTLCLGTWRRAELGCSDGLRDCTTLMQSGAAWAQEREARGTRAPSRQPALGAR